MSLVELRPFSLDVRAKVLLRDGEIEKIPMKTVEVLIALVERRGQVVTREELFARVWPDTVVEEANLTVHVSLLRKLLGDAAPIETVPKRGYRIPVAKAPADAAVPGREAVLRGRYFWNKLTRRSLKRAAQCFEEALAAERASATALSGLADTRIMQGLLGFELDAGVFARSLGTAREAVLADPRCAEAQTSLASACVLGAWDFPSAQTALAEARRLAPARVEPLLWSGLFLAMRGAFLPAIEAARQAQALDPLSLTAGVGLGLHAYLTQQHQPEVEPIRLALDLERRRRPFGGQPHDGERARTQPGARGKDRGGRGAAPEPARARAVAVPPRDDRAGPRPARERARGAGARPAPEGGVARVDADRSDARVAAGRRAVRGRGPAGAGGLNGADQRNAGGPPGGRLRT
ncbi:MAG: winged helix-turn-helix domain-containing protein [Vicinamibacteria bacterium]